MTVTTGPLPDEAHAYGVPAFWRTTRVTCDGGGRDGACRSAVEQVREAMRADTAVDSARRAAARLGWTLRRHTGGILIASTEQDLCPAHRP